MTDVNDPTDIIVRIGMPEDVHGIMELAEAVARENSPVEPNLRKILENGIWPALHKDGGLVGVVGPRSGEVQGFVLLKVAEPWHSSERVIEECGVYVHPDHRKFLGDRASAGKTGQTISRAAMLYKFCKQVAEQMGYKLIIATIGLNRQSAKFRYYERLFGSQYGAIFVYQPSSYAAPTATPVAAE